MKKVKTLGCMILAVILMIGITACTGSQPSSSAPASTASSTVNSAASSQAPAKSDFPGGWQPTTSYDNHVKLTLATVQTLEGYDYTAGDDYAKWWSEHFNYDIQVTSLTLDNWAERLRLWINSGDMPDICVYDYKHPDATTFVDQGLIKRLPDGWKDRWPNVSHMNDISTIGPAIEKTFDGNYFLPRVRFGNNIPGDPLPNHYSFVFRKDWAEKVGFPIKSSYKASDIIEYGKLIKEKDPGGLGNSLLPLSIRPRWAVSCFIDMNSTYAESNDGTPFYKDKDGVYKWGPASDETLRGLKLYLEAYQSGALQPEFYTLKDQEDYDQLRVSAVSGGFFGEANVNNIQRTCAAFKSNAGIDPEANVGFATVVGEDGYYHQCELLNYWGTYIFNPKIDDEKFERWMDMLDFAASDKGFEFTQLGFEGIDWESKSGEYASLLPAGKLINGQTGKYPSMSQVIASMNMGSGFGFDNPNIPKFERDQSWQLYTERSKLASPDTFTRTDWDLFAHDSPNMRRAVAIDYVTDYTNLVTTAVNADDLEARWKKWIEEQMPTIQPVLDELNAMK